LRLLIDSNIFLEILLDRENKESAKSLLIQIDRHEFYISDYSLQSIGLILFRAGQPEKFTSFVKEMIIEPEIAVPTLLPQNATRIFDTAMAHRLDFDDAYQYAMADVHNLQIVSFDNDFNETPRGKKTPAEILATN
jgi:predicted nucleic acid-binding protein